MRHLITALCLLFIFCAAENAAMITVTNTNDSGAASLRQAIANAAPGDTIDFDATVFSSPQTITLTSGELIIDKNLTIQGPGQALLSISGNHASRVFNINSQAIAATLDGMTIRNGGQSGYGGGIANGGILTVTNCTISNNGAYSGGGGILNGGTLMVSNSIISGNSSEIWGGGIFNGGTLTVSNSAISGNYTSYFEQGSGGGIYNGGTLTVSNSTITGNTAEIGYGGGIGNADGNVTINNSTVSGNAAFYGGGGVYNTYVCDDIDNCSGHTAYIYISNGTISGNTGAGIVSNGEYGSNYSVEHLWNTIVADGIGGSIETASHNLIGDAASSGGIQNGVNGNIVGVNPLLGPLANNGGTNMTHALLSGSPAINTGDNCVLTENGCGYSHPALPTDQRGVPRSGSVDIGAFEFSAPARSALADFDGDERTDVSVFRPNEGNWWLLQTTAGFGVANWGVASDRLVPGDYDGDGRADLAVYRGDGQWWIAGSSGGFSFISWGLATDKPIPGDYDGDGKADAAVYRAEGEWWVNGSTGTATVTSFGTSTDVPIPSRYTL